jgi:aminoglycoside phosphotransferase (APT) family kinase protein
MAEEAWRAAVDLDALAAWMDGEGLGAGPIASPTLLAGGTQNIILLFERAGRRYVLRRPAAHLRANANETIRREIRVLGALAASEVPHPRLIAASPREDVLGAAFYLMEPVAGFNVTLGMPALHAGDPQVRRAMGFALVEGIVKLGRVDPFAAGLGDFGRIEGYLERQVGRWRKQLEGYVEHEGWAGPQVLPGVARIGAWLESRRPARFTPGILHGDYHLANVLYRNDGPDLAAIVDWELATLGDPLIDLGWVLTTWPRPDDPTSMQITPWEGFPEADELLAYYRSHSTRDLAAIDWYVVLACYKLGILLEGTAARACAGKADKATGERFHRRSVALFERALTLI